MPRFVILEHDHPFLHWDLMLEVKDGLRAWRLLQGPARGATIPATILSLHRKRYLDYEGPVSGNRGKVTRWDGGSYEIISVNPSEANFLDLDFDSLDIVEVVMEFEAQIEITIKLEGSRLRGPALLTHQSSERWSLELIA